MTIYDMTRQKMQSRVSRPSLLFTLLSLVYSLYAFGTPNRQFQKITITAINIPLGEVFKKIHQQTGISITNKTDETELSNRKKVTVNFVKTDITEVMSFLLIDYKDLNFIQNDKNIVIIKTFPLIPKGHFIANQKDTATVIFPFSGKIVDASGNPIPGATIKIKDSKHGTISNSDGSFRLSDVNKGTLIVISSIGFESKEIVVDIKNTTIELASRTNNLDEKVVMAYGSTTKRLNTGNISSLKAIDIEKQPPSNPLLSLQGRVPGVVIQQASGLFNSGVTIHIQGLNSIQSGNDPFFVIDGVPYISQLLPIGNASAGASGSSGIAGNPLNFLNSSDIESIEVLKDADATAIYGSRAANGAVLITTKKGKSGETKTDITLQTGWGKVGHMLRLLNTKEYLNMRHEALANDDITTPSQSDYDLNGTWDTTRDINWQKELIGNTANYTDAQVSLSGGTSLTQFLIGAGYNKQTSVFPGKFSDTKGSLHISINNTSSNQKFKVRLSASYMYDNNKPPLGDITNNAITLSPVAPDPYNSDGSINWAPTAAGSTTYYLNPLAYLVNVNTNKTTNLTSNLVVGYELIPGLEVRSSFGYNNMVGNEITKQYLTSVYPEYRMYYYRSSIFFNNRLNSCLVEPQIEFKRNLNKGKFNVLVGSTISQNNNDQSVTTATGFSNDLVMEDLASAINLSGSNINSIYKYNALYGRMTYNWMDKYIVNLNARRDGSSRFGPKNQFHNFGSIGIAWIFSQEVFFENIFPTLSFGKIRGSYGTTGNDQIGDYQFLNLYQPILVIGNLYQNALGLAASTLTNPYLQWEETKKLQLGLELGFIQDKILFTLNFNQNRSSNQLLPFSLPITTGFTSIIKNFPAVIQNTGWEFTLNTINIKTKDLSWTTNINLTIPKNKLLSFSGENSYNTISVGKSITMQRLFQYNGVNDTTGIYEFKDAKGNITSNPSDPSDKISIVTPDPKFYGGIQNSFSYKGFSLDFLFTFCKQNAQDNLSYGMLNAIYPGTFNYGKSNQPKSILDRWQKEGDNARLQPFSTSGKTLSLVGSSDAIWSDASYIKLKNVSISWQLPDRWKKIAHLQNLRLFMHAQNLITITNYKSFDPETPGLALPPLRVITFGVHITL